MDNGTKLSSEQIKSLMNEAKSGKKDELLKKYLSDDDAERVRDILSDTDKLKSFLSSPLAKQLINRLNKEKDGSE
ncbi:MAG: hypothetical protein UHM85_08930 [Acutalibacteraceae bacterium]|nr:hypothetical protein [Acutalibacteraceae bacterium]